MARYEMRKFVAPEFIFGIGARHRAAFYAQNMLARRVLVVTDPGVTAAGWPEQLLDSLDETGIAATVFDAITPNPKDHEVMAGAQRYRDAGCDVIIAIGGGSVIDCAKGIGIVSANGGHILDYEGVDRIPRPGPPLICIPTTAGTSADISQFAIINNTGKRYKIAIISKSVVPDVALVDPETTTTMPPRLTACTGLDALTHAVEAFVSTASSPVVDVHALAAIALVRDNLPRVIAEPTDTEARENMALASLQAGLAFSNASLGAVHAMAHSLGGYLDLPHGESNALLLDHVIRFNHGAAGGRYAPIARAFDVADDGEMLARAIDALRSRCGIEAGLGRRGVTHGVIDELAPWAAKDACLFTNPRQASVADIKTIYAEAL